MKHELQLATYMTVHTVIIHAMMRVAMGTELDRTIMVQ